MIDDGVLRQIRSRVEAVTDRRWETGGYETQDDGLFLLVNVVVAVSQSDEINRREILRLVGDVCRALVPERSDNYSWMITIELNGRVIQNVMGGWAGMGQAFPRG